MTRPVRLPHDALRDLPRSADSDQGVHTGYTPGGVFEYARTLEVPAAWHDRTVRLEFEGVYRDAAVFVNGDAVIHEPNGYNAFEAVLDPYLRYGEANRITVEARAHRARAPLRRAGRERGVAAVEVAAGGHQDQPRPGEGHHVHAHGQRAHLLQRGVERVLGRLDAVGRVPGQARAPGDALLPRPYRDQVAGGPLHVGLARLPVGLRLCAQPPLHVAAQHHAQVVAQVLAPAQRRAQQVLVRLQLQLQMLSCRARQGSPFERSTWSRLG